MIDSSLRWGFKICIFNQSVDIMFMKEKISFGDKIIYMSNVVYGRPESPENVLTMTSIQQNTQAQLLFSRTIPFSKGKEKEIKYKLFIFVFSLMTLILSLKKKICINDPFLQKNSFSKTKEFWAYKSIPQEIQTCQALFYVVISLSQKCLQWILSNSVAVRDPLSQVSSQKKLFFLWGEWGTQWNQSIIMAQSPKV